MCSNKLSVDEDFFLSAFFVHNSAWFVLSIRVVGQLRWTCTHRALLQRLLVGCGWVGEELRVWMGREGRVWMSWEDFMQC